MQTGDVPGDADPKATIQILHRYRAGEQQALDDLYGRYFERIHAVVRLRMGARLRAKAESVDIVNDAFLASLEGLENFEYRTEGDFFHWLCKITENRIHRQAEHFGAAKRDPGRERPLAVQRPSRDSMIGPVNELARLTTPASEAERQEDCRLLEEAIADLPEPQREALLLVRYEGLSFQEAAGIMERTSDAVRMLVARAVVALGKSFGRGGEEDED